MSVIETMIDIPAEHEKNVCGQFDTYLKKIERTLHVTMIARDGEIKIIGPEQTIGQARSVFSNLIELSKRGNTITEQNVDYALSLSFTEKDGQILEIDKDIICRTITGKPVKPKTLGQKKYVEAIKKNVVTLGIGPAGTGKTYLAVAAAVAAFNAILPGTIGGTIIQISLLFFALSTILGWSYYGERCWAYLSNNNKAVVWIFKVVFVLVCIVGATGNGTLMWDISDTLNGMMAIPNLIGLLLLSNVIIRSTNDYFKKH